MQAEYRRDTHHSYLVLFEEYAAGGESFQKKMFLENRITGFLSCKMHDLDCSGRFFYDISSRQSLAGILESRAMDGECMQNLLRCLLKALEGLQSYLLDTGGFLLRPEWIFCGPDGKSFEFCYYPDAGADWKSQLQQLAEYLLPRLEHKNREAVRLGYNFYQFSMEGRVTALELENLLKNESEKTDEEETGKGELPLAVLPASDVKEKEREEIPASRDALLQAFFDQEEAVEETQDPFRERLKKLLPLLLQFLPPIVLIIGIGVFLFFGYYGAAAGLGGILLIFFAGSLILRWKKGREKERDATMEQYVIVQDWLEEEKLEEVMQNTREKERTLPKEEPDPDATCLLTDAAAYKRLAKGYLVPESSADHATIAIQKDVTTIGKGDQADVILKNLGISRMHARITCRGDHCFLTDLNSRNGTSLNGVLLNPEEEQLLADGDWISFGNTRYEWRCYRIPSGN